MAERAAATQFAVFGAMNDIVRLSRLRGGRRDTYTPQLWWETAFGIICFFGGYRFLGVPYRLPSQMIENISCGAGRPRL